MINLNTAGHIINKSNNILKSLDELAEKMCESYDIENNIGCKIHTLRSLLESESNRHVLNTYSGLLVTAKKDLVKQKKYTKSINRKIDRLNAKRKRLTKYMPILPDTYFDPDYDVPF